MTIGHRFSAATTLILVTALASTALPARSAADEQVTFGTPAPFSVDRPNTNRGAYVSQIGDENAAQIRQSSPQQFTGIEQHGNGNAARVIQAGDGAHYARVRQTGDGNAVSLGQTGASAQVASIGQTGNGNIMAIEQIGGIAGNGLLAVQAGNDNAMSVTQAGSGNQAELSQTGDGNAMTASQLGDNARLVWAQVGNNLSNLQIAQGSGQALQITQTR